VILLATTISKYRLHSSAFERPDEQNKADPKRVIFLSVEGDETERTYFQHLNNHLDNSLIKIEVLRHRRGDGYSDPEHVIELLNEYMNVREGEIVPQDLLQLLTSQYSKDELHAYLNNPDVICPAKQKRIKEDLLLIGINVDYRRYLQQYSGDDNNNDVFAVVLDRDCGNHSRELMEQCVKLCTTKGYNCYISNPCFEFWLLLHLCDVKLEFDESELVTLLQNPKVSKRHTKTSKEVTTRAEHGKTISAQTFSAHYYPNIAHALTRASQFACDYPDLYDSLGTNLPQLFSILGFPLSE